VIQKEWYTKEQIKENREVLFLFGDNAERTGTGGQAKVCRNEPNCVGVITKARPSHENESDYLNDYNLMVNILNITRDFGRVINHLKKGGTVIFPADGIGTGLAMLKEKAPLTFDYVQLMWDYAIKVGEEYATK
jgi:hypothetical protein